MLRLAHEYLLQMAETNIPENGLIWTAEDASREFGVSRATVFRKFKNAGLVGSRGVTTVQVVKALFGDSNEERSKLLKAQRKLAEGRLEILRKRYVDGAAVEAMLFQALGDVVRQLEDTHITQGDYELVCESFNKIQDKLWEIAGQAVKAITADTEEEDEE